MSVAGVPLLTGPALVAAALLMAAGAQKVLDPTMTVGALQALRIPASAAAVRAGSVAELLLGATAIAVGGAASWWLVAATYAAFTGFVVAALRSRTMIGTCGCFGREDTPPHPSHVAANLILTAVAVMTALLSPGPPAEALVDHPGQGVLVAVLSLAAVYLLFGIYVGLPRLLRVGRRADPLGSLSRR